MYLHAEVQQVAETSPEHCKKSVLPGPKEALKGTSHQAFLTILHGTQEGALPWAGKA